MSIPSVDHKINLIGHERQRNWFRNAIEGQRLASTFLFVGPEGIGKRTFALFLAQTMLCERHAPKLLDPCGQCPSCVQVQAGSHPDILQVAKPEDRAYIPIELLVGPREARMQEGLCHDIRLRPMSGDRRVAILDDCDVLNTEGANSLLKTLEEPPPRALIILIGTSLQRQLPTIRSRCQVVRFDIPADEQARNILKLSVDPDSDDDQSIDVALKLADGDLTKAAMLLSEEVRLFSGELTNLLSQEPPPAITLAKTISGFVEAAGTEAPRRRARMRQASVLASDHYRKQIRELAINLSGSSDSAPQTLEQALYRLQRSLDVRYQVDRNANQATLIESWSVDLQHGNPA